MEIWTEELLETLELDQRRPSIQAGQRRRLQTSRHLMAHVLMLSLEQHVHGDTGRAGGKGETQQHQRMCDVVPKDVLAQPSKGKQFNTAVRDVVGAITCRQKPVFEQPVPVLQQSADVEVCGEAKIACGFVNLRRQTPDGHWFLEPAWTHASTSGILYALC